MRNIKDKLFAGLAGLAIGGATLYLINGWYNVIPWACVAMLVGYLSKTRKHALINGAVFGYFLFLAYIILGYKGSMDTGSLVKFIFFTLAFSLIGALVGLVGGYGGFLMKKKKVKN